MKRSFSLSELQNAIDSDISTSSNTAGDLAVPSGPVALARSGSGLGGTLKKSVSMGHLDNLVDQDSGTPSEADSERLPSLAALGLSLPSQAHGYEELKRGRGVRGRLPTSSSSGSLSSLVSPSQAAMEGPVHSPSHLELPAARKLVMDSRSLQGPTAGKGDDETRGAASALLDLFGQNEGAKLGLAGLQSMGPVAAVLKAGGGEALAAGSQSPAAQSQSVVMPGSDGPGGKVVPSAQPEHLPAMVLPPLRELLGGRSLSDQNKGEAASSPGPVRGPAPSQVQIQPTATDSISGGAGGLVLGDRKIFQFTAKQEEEKQGSSSPLISPGVQPSTDNSGSPTNEGAPDADAKHNKYCHFCQHVKVKRVTSMLACENPECARRFCEHCLVTHLSNVYPPDGKSLNDTIDGKWLCPICRKVCCCAIQVCNRQHRHCKAYRYRQRRAEQAAKRTLAASEPRVMMDRRPMEMPHPMAHHPMMPPAHVMRHPAAFVGQMPGMPGDMNAAAALGFMVANGAYMPQGHPQMMFARNG